MDDTIHKIEDHNVYEHMMTGRWERGYMDAVTTAAEFSPIYPGDRKWEEMAMRYLDEVLDLSIEGLEVIGIASGGKCVGICGYRMTSDRHIVVRGPEVELPYELYMAVGERVEVSADMIHAAQLFIANQEGLRIVQLSS